MLGFWDNAICTQLQLQPPANFGFTLHNKIALPSSVKIFSLQFFPQTNCLCSNIRQVPMYNVGPDVPQRQFQWDPSVFIVPDALHCGGKHLFEKNARTMRHQLCSSAGCWSNYLQSLSLLNLNCKILHILTQISTISSIYLLNLSSIYLLNLNLS